MATQVERREATVSRLVEAAVRVLAETGYASASVARICQVAGVSQGGLFRHFDTRLALIAAAIEAMGRRHVEAVDALADGESLDAVVDGVRDVCRSDAHAAWHEVIVAARADPDLRAAVAPVLVAYEAALNALATRLLAPHHPDPDHARMVVLSILHLFDSEATTRRVYANPAVEQARRAWALDLLRHELAGRGQRPTTAARSEGSPVRLGTSPGG